MARVHSKQSWHSVRTTEPGMATLDSASASYREIREEFSRSPGSVLQNFTRGLEPMRRRARKRTRVRCPADRPHRNVFRIRQLGPFVMSTPRPRSPACCAVAGGLLFAQVHHHHLGTDPIRRRVSHPPPTPHLPTASHKRRGISFPFVS